MTDDGPVVLRDMLPFAEAHVARGLLESAGIACELVPTGMWDGRTPPRLLRLLVRESDLADADAALREVEA